MNNFTGNNISDGERLGDRETLLFRHKERSEESISSSCGIYRFNLPGRRQKLFITELSKGTICVQGNNRIDGSLSKFDSYFVQGCHWLKAYQHGCLLKVSCHHLSFCRIGIVESTVTINDFSACKGKHKWNTRLFSCLCTTRYCFFRFWTKSERSTIKQN